MAPSFTEATKKPPRAVARRRLMEALDEKEKPSLRCAGERPIMLEKDARFRKSRQGARQKLWRNAKGLKASGGRCACFHLFA
jgi:hypothetical protein